MTSIFFQTYDKREPTYSKYLKTTGRINPKTSIHGTRVVRGHRGFREKSSYRTCGLLLTEMKEERGLWKYPSKWLEENNCRIRILQPTKITCTNQNKHMHR